LNYLQIIVVKKEEKKHLIKPCLPVIKGPHGFIALHPLTHEINRIIREGKLLQFTRSSVDVDVDQDIDNTAE